MAQIVRRPRTDGGSTWQIKWRDGGTRHGDWQSESFTAEARARAFKLDVEEAGHRWPEGWVKGQGYITTPPPTDVVTFATVRDAYWVAQQRRVTRGKLKPHSLARDRRTAELHLAAFNDLPFVDIELEDIESWVDTQLTAGASPKSVRNRHGLLAAIMKHGALAMRLRADVPTALTDLPEVDAATARQVRFLQHSEWALLRRHMREDVHLLVDVLLATGARWGEASALRAGDATIKGPEEVVLHIQRAWSQRASDDPAPINTKAGETRAWKLGPPKSRRARFVVVAGAVATALVDAIKGLPPDEYIFRTRGGAPWRYPEFYERRWAPARDAAVADGLNKHATIHMLRHTTVVWALAGGVPIQVISEMLGHASIQITFDIYGGLIDLHDAQAAKALAATMLAATSAHTPT